MAATSVLKLVVDDKEYNASLKNAKQGMQALQDSLQAAGKSFLDVDKSVVEYARALWKMDTTSKSAKGRIGEMSSAFVDLSLQYKHLTDQEKQSPFGKAMSESLDALKTRVIDAKQELADFENQLKDIGDVKIDTSSGGLFGENGLTGMLAVTGGNLLAQGVQKLGAEMVDAVQQSIELARQGEGVRIAFERLNNPNLLSNLKEATHGTVSELELMKAAIKFENFKLPLEDLATYLAFAQQKAQDTGDSVDNMVTSIVNGLGRQSVQILDNLGISASEIRNRMKEGGDMTQVVAQIIREEMTKSGEYVETAATRAARASAAAYDELEKLGRQATPVAEEWANVWNEIKIGGITLMTTVLSPLADSIRSIRELLSEPFEIKFKADIPNLGEGSNIDDNGNFIKRPKNGNWAGYDAANGRYYNEIASIPEISVTGTKSKQKKSGSTKAQSLPSYGDFSKQLSKSILDTDALKSAGEQLSPYAMMLDEIKTKILDIQDADLGSALAIDGEKKVKKEIQDATDLIDQQRKAYNMAAIAAENFGSAMSGLEDPAARAAGTVISAIANIALGFATASVQAGALGPFAWAAWLAAGTAAMATTIGLVHSLTGYANGGMIEGNSYSGDNLMAMGPDGGLIGLNAGEVILNRAQQNSLAGQLDGNGIGSLNLRGVLDGEKIVIVADRYLKRSGKGELAVWK